MVRAEIEMRRQEHGDRDIVQTMRGHGVFRLEHRVEIVGVPIVPDEGVGDQVQVGFRRVTFMEWYASIWINNDNSIYERRAGLGV